MDKLVPVSTNQKSSSTETEGVNSGRKRPNILRNTNKGVKRSLPAQEASTSAKPSSSKSQKVTYFIEIMSESEDDIPKQEESSENNSVFQVQNVTFDNEITLVGPLNIVFGDNNVADQQNVASNEQNNPGDQEIVPIFSGIKNNGQETKESVNKASESFEKELGCKITGCIGKRYFPVPTTTEMLQIWRLCINDETLAQGQLLCENHFLPIDVTRLPKEGEIGILKAHVVPSVKKVIPWCAIPSCTNMCSTMVNMFSIPIWRDHANWIESCNLNVTSVTDLMQYRICDKHFNSDSAQNTIYDLILKQSEEKMGQKITKNMIKLHIAKIYQPSRRFCAFINCATHIFAPVKRFAFPKSPETLIAWKVAAGIPQEVVNVDMTSLWVCYRHVDNPHTYVKQETLPETIIPNSHITYADQKAVKTNPFWVMKQNLTMVPKTSLKTAKNQIAKCCFEHCGNFANLHYFPLENNRFELCVKAVKNTETITAKDKDYYIDKKICLEHFEFCCRLEDNTSGFAAPTPSSSIENDTSKAEKDASVVWQEAHGSQTNHTALNCLTTGRMELYNNRIVFPNQNRNLKFGQAVPKYGPSKFHYRAQTLSGSLEENIKEGSNVQTHSVIMIDDDDDMEVKTLKMVKEIVDKNEDFCVTPKGKRLQQNSTKKATSLEEDRDPLEI